MRRLASLVAILLMLVMASPLLACVSQLTMTPAERACCVSMRGQCDHVAAHRCCQIHVRNDLSQIPAQKADAPQLTLAAVAPDAPSFLSIPGPQTVSFSVQESDRPPPLLEHLATIVLRI